MVRNIRVYRTDPLRLPRRPAREWLGRKGLSSVELTEDGLLSAVRKVLSGAGPEVVVPIGDDAAVVRPAREIWS